MSQKSKETAPTFATDMAEIQKLIQQLEGGELDIEEALQGFEAGMQRIKRCRTALSQAETRVQKIIDAHGQTEPFNPQE